jgi:Tfp pilus assembly protein PilO
MPTTPQNRDLLGTIDLIVRMVSVVLIPIVIVVIGNRYNTQQQKLEEIRSSNENTANRLTTLLKNFSSENPRERKLAVVIATYLAEKKQLPGELVSVLRDIAESDDNKDVSNAATLSLDAVARGGTTQAPEAKAILNSLPGRVYIQVPGNDRAGQANKIAALLSGLGYRVPETEIRQGCPSENQVRYFHAEDKDEAMNIQKNLAGTGLAARILFVPGFEKKVRNRQFEIWLAK